MTLVQGNPNFFQFATWAPGGNTAGSQLFHISQGVAQNQRVGNTIKIKRWIIKGLIQPSQQIFNETPQVLFNTNVGYVDIFFGRLNNNLTAIDNQLIQLYQDGNTAQTPYGLASTILYPINKDRYKIYFRKRFKMGASFPDPTENNQTNNDFSLTRTFGFDVTKYILKNKHVKYQDAEVTPNDDMVENLTIFAVFYPAVGNIPINDLTYPTSYYTVNYQTYAEYEDA